MTIVLIGKRLSFGLLVRLVCIGALVLLLPLVMLSPPVGCDASNRKWADEFSDEEMLGGLEMFEDSDGKLDGDRLDDITKNLGERLKETMIGEVDRLIEEVESGGRAGGGDQASGGRPRARPSQRVDAEELEQLRERNKKASEDIKIAVELTGQSSALPQAGLHSIASSFGKRLQEAGRFISKKINSLKDNLKRRIPQKLKRFFVWEPFLSFRIKYNKVYSTLSEFMYRQMVFMRSQVRVHMQHIRFTIGLDSHLDGQNQYSDMTQREFSKMFANPLINEDNELPDTVDERTLEMIEKLTADGKDVFGHVIPEAVRSKQKTREKRELNRQDDFDAGAYARAGGRPAQEEYRGLHKTTVGRGGPNDGQMGEEEYEEEEEVFMSELDEEEEDDDDDEEDLESVFAELGNELIVTSEDPSDLVQEFAGEPDTEALDELEKDIDNFLSGYIEPYDLRKTGCMPRPENQLDCGACYAFAVNQLATYYNCMDRLNEHIAKGHTNVKPQRLLVSYSPDFIIECGAYSYPKEKKINGCDGGRGSAVFRFIRMVGVTPTSAYEIAKASAAAEREKAAQALAAAEREKAAQAGAATGENKTTEPSSATGQNEVAKDSSGKEEKKEKKKIKDRTCPYPAPYSFKNTGWQGWFVPVPAFEGSVYQRINVINVDYYLRKVGPVLVTLQVWPTFKDYQVGIVNNLNEPETKDLHTMLLVGTDVDPITNKQYYIIMNSHGITWGHLGYLKIGREMFEKYGTGCDVILKTPDGDPKTLLTQAEGLELEEELIYRAHQKALEAQQALKEQQEGGQVLKEQPAQTPTPTPRQTQARTQGPRR